MGTKSQEAANSGLVDCFVFGRNGPALHHFRNNHRSALGQPPLAVPAVAAVRGAASGQGFRRQLRRRGAGARRRRPSGIPREPR